ncbi:MAG: NTP transferase domain-containing protein [Polyangiaceae bacterium]
MIDKAVILAAGLGNRISAVAKDVPKPLLPLSGEPGSHPTFLDWHFRALERAGCKEAYFVGNAKTFGTKLPESKTMKSAWILNPTEDVSTSGSGHSAWFAWKSEHSILDGKSRVVLMDADILYDPSIYEALAAGPSTGPSKTLVCTEFRDTQEEVLVFADPKAPSVPVMHGKGLLRTPMTEKLQCVGEATGILLWEPGDHAALAQVTDWVVRYSTAKARSEHEDITQRMMMAGRMQIAGFARHVPFMECDTPDEYHVLTTEMFPRLRGTLGF